MAATYTVKKGDTLSGIAQKYLSTIRNAAGNPKLNIYTPNGGAVQKLADWNSISNPNYIVVGQVIKLEPGSSSSKKTPAEETKPKINIFGILSSDGTSRAIYCTWEWSKSHTSGYQLYWQEYVQVSGTYQWVNSSGNYPCTETYKFHNYTASANAKKVRMRMRAVAETHTVDGQTVPYWKINNTGYSDYTDWVSYDFSDNAPSTPGNPSVSISNYTLTASLTNIDPNINATEIEFQIVKNDLKSVATCKSTITYNKASITYTVAGGNSYGVRCRAVRGTKKSDWTDFVYESSKPGGTPEIKTCKAESETSVRLKWSEVKSGTSTTDPIKYEIQYIKDKTHFDISGEASSIPNLTTLSYIVTGLESGDEYFFRVRATNSKGDGEWSEIKSVTIGTKPTSPTTWSSTTVTSPNQNVNLYWAHNTVDGSTQQYAQVKITAVNAGNGVIHTNTYTLNTSDTAPAFSTSTVYSLNNFVRYNNEIYRYKSTVSSSGAWDDSKWEATKGTYTLVTSSYPSGAKVTWTVRTAGVKKDANNQYEYGDWSVDRTIDIYAQPTLAISLVDYQNRTAIDDEPIEEITTFPFYISAEASPNSQTPISYHISITADETYQTVDNVGNIKQVSKNEEVYSKNFDVTTFALVDNAWLNLVEFSAGNISLENGISYTATCTVGMNTGLTAQASLSFLISWTNVLYVPNAYVIINDDESITTNICPYCKDTNDTLVSNVTLSVYRREFDGEFTELSSGITNDENTYVKDPHPALDYARYRIVAKSTTTGAVSYQDLPGYYIGEKAVVLQWDESWSNFDVLDPQDATPMEEPSWSGSIIKLPYNIDVSDNYDPDVSLVEYIGRKSPVTYYGTHIGEKATWNVEIEKDDKNTLYALRRLAVWMGDVYVREPSGSGYWANVNVSFSQKHCELTIPVTLSLTRVDGVDKYETGTLRVQAIDGSNMDYGWY